MELHDEKVVGLPQDLGPRWIFYSHAGTESFFPPSPNTVLTKYNYPQQEHNSSRSVREAWKSFPESAPQPGLNASKL